jgi:hypothetical protein
MCASNEFKQLAPYNGPKNLTNYLVDIWKIWFDMLYEAGGSKYFQNISAETEFEWLDNNPFFEIKKYDIFYWGLDKEFHPIKLKSCLKQPPPPPKPPIKAFKTNLYAWDWDDKGTGGRLDFTSFFTQPMTIDGEVYYPLGTIVENNYSSSVKNKSGKFIAKIEFH